MATEKLDPRAALAKMEAEETAANEAAAKLAEANAAKRVEILAGLRDAELADVKEKCKLHGFSASDLRGALKVKGGKKAGATPRKSAAGATPRKSAAGKTAAKKRTPKP
jgi:hypothetical protein